MFPEPDCIRGYSFDLLSETLGEKRFAELMDWMHGQTMALCDGRCYNYETNSYEDIHEAHGPVVYSCDVESFLAGGPILD